MVYAIKRSGGDWIIFRIEERHTELVRWLRDECERVAGGEWPAEWNKYRIHTDLELFVEYGFTSEQLEHAMILQSMKEVHA